MTASLIAECFMIGMFVLGTLLTVAAVGKPRRPLTGGQAAVVVLVNAAYVVLILMFWGSPR